VVHSILVGLVVAAVIVAFGLILWNYRRQRDFEGTGHTPPEDYD
jgi:hypothetical protein